MRLTTLTTFKQVSTVFIFYWPYIAIGTKERLVQLVRLVILEHLYLGFEFYWQFHSVNYRVTLNYSKWDIPYLRNETTYFSPRFSLEKNNFLLDL